MPNLELIKYFDIFMFMLEGNDNGMEPNSPDPPGSE